MVGGKNIFGQNLKGVRWGVGAPIMKGIYKNYWRKAILKAKIFSFN